MKQCTAELNIVIFVLHIISSEAFVIIDTLFQK